MNLHENCGYYYVGRPHCGDVIVYTMDFLFAFAPEQQYCLSPYAVYTLADASNMVHHKIFFFALV